MHTIDRLQLNSEQYNANIDTGIRTDVDTRILTTLGKNRDSCFRAAGKGLIGTNEGRDAQLDAAARVNDQ